MKDCENCRNNRTNSRCIYCIIKSNGEPSEWCPDMEDTLRRYCENDVKTLMTVMLNTRYGYPSRQKALHKIKNVIFNDPATIVFWNDGTKTVVKCGKDDTFDPEKGLAMAIYKYFFDNAGYFNDVFKKWIPKKGESDGKDQ